MINLVKNALKFTEYGTVRLKALYDSSTSQLHLSVEDTGVGIKEEDIPLLFNKFGKLQRTAAMNDAGIGLGLTIVKQIVECAGGKIQASSPGLD